MSFIEGVDWSFLMDRNKPSLSKQFEDWLYGSWSEEKLKEYELYNIIPGVSQYMDYLLSLRADSEYLRRYGMDYSDIHDPRKLGQTASASNGMRFGLNFVSSNVKRLYK